MTPFVRLTAVAAPLPRANVDTDQIIPARFLLRSRAEDYGRLLFHDMRFRDDGSEVPEFPLNRPQWRDAGILITGRNFGCGSAREQAVWAFADFGIRAIIAPSFADIFAGNCIRNGLLPVRLQEAQATALRDLVTDSPESELTVDLFERLVVPSHGPPMEFAIPDVDRLRLIEGRDDIDSTLECAAQIDAFEEHQSAVSPWDAHIPRGE